MINSLRIEVSKLSQRLHACENRHSIKDGMIARRDKSLDKAHVYIETLKAEKAALEETVVKLKDAIRDVNERMKVTHG